MNERRKLEYESFAFKHLKKKRYKFFLDPEIYEKLKEEAESNGYERVGDFLRGLLLDEFYEK